MSSIHGKANGPNATGLPSVKVHRSQHYTIRGRSVSPLVLEDLGAQGDRFFRKLQKRLEMDLGDEPVAISVGAKPGGQPLQRIFDTPEWITSEYSYETRQAVIYIHGRLAFDFEPLLRSLKVRTLHVLLNRNKRGRLPVVLEDGLAFYLSRPWSSRDQIRAIFAFRNLDSQPAWVQAESADHRAILDADQQFLAFLFVRWMWRQHPEAMQFFVAKYLSGDAWVAAYEQARFDDLTVLWDRFVATEKPRHGLFHLLLTLDFWIAVLAFAFLIAAAGWTVRAVGSARLRTQPIDDMTQSVDQDVIDELADSPVFQARPPPKSVQEPKPDKAVRAAPAPTEPLLNLHAQEEIDVDLDAFFDTKVARDSVSMHQGRPSSPGPEKKKVTQKHARQGTSDDAIEGSDTLERDLDSFFKKIAPESEEDD